MPRRHPSKFVKKELAAPQLSRGWFVRTVNWLFRSEASSSLFMGVLFALGLTLRYVAPFSFSNAREVVVGAISLLIFGVFLGVIMVTDGNKNYRGNGLRTRVVCGVIAGAAIAVLLAAPGEGVVLGALVGAILGFFGEDWAKYI